MKVLITGVSGYIGSHLAGFLSKYPELDVYGLSRTEILDDDIRMLIMDTKVFKLDEDSLHNILSSIRPDVVIHLASCFLTQHTYYDIKNLIQSNIEFPTELLEAMRGVGTKRIINAGTSWQHYNSECYDPVNLYAATKQAFEDILKYYVSAQDFSAINLKIFDTYGRLDKRKKLISLLDDLSINKKSLDMSPGEQLLDLVHIDDVCEAFRISLERVKELKSNEMLDFAITNENRLSLKDLVKLYEEVNSVKLNINFGAREYREREVMVPCVNLKKLPDWNVKVNLHSGLKCNQ